MQLSPALKPGKSLQKCASKLRWKASTGSEKLLPLSLRCRHEDEQQGKSGQGGKTQVGVKMNSKARQAKGAKNRWAWWVAHVEVLRKPIPEDAELARAPSQPVSSS